MKKFLLLSLAALAMVACNKSGEEKGQQLDPNAMLSIRPAPGVRSENPEHLSALEIVKQTTEVTGWNLKVLNKPLGLAFGDHQKDTINVRLMTWAIDIITSSGAYRPDFIESTDLVLRHIVLEEGADKETVDTIAYIPNAVASKAAKETRAAYDAGDYATCYRIFNEAYTFTPITGAEWRELKAQGKN